MARSDLIDLSGERPSVTDGITITLLDGADVLQRVELAGFVVRPWLLASMDLAIGHQTRNLSQHARARARQAYCARWHRQLEQLLGRSRLALAHVDDEPDTWIGWACADGAHQLHWLYVKSAMRTLGIGRRLLRAAAPHATHHTFAAPPALQPVAQRYGMTGPTGLRRSA